MLLDNVFTKYFVHRMDNIPWHANVAQPFFISTISGIEQSYVRFGITLGLIYLGHPIRSTRYMTGGQTIRNDHR